MSEHSLFTSSGYVHEPERLKFIDQGVDLLALPPILRVLLSTDGTVTKTLESYFWEPVSVINKAQFELPLNDWPATYLPVVNDRCLLSRSVHLVGDQSQRLFAHAQTYLDTALLPHPVAEQLLAGRIGVGEIIRESGLETYREIKRIGFSADDSELWRCYRILFNQKAVMQITEYFPIELYCA